MKQDRVLEIFFRSLHGENIKVRDLANEYAVSTKSISRDINDLKAFMAEHRELVGNTELEYSHKDKCYKLHMDSFLTNKELFALLEVLIGARAFSQAELWALVDKLKRLTTPEDRPKLTELLRKELFNYPPVKHDCESVQDVLWQLINCIIGRKKISVEYYRMDRKCTAHRLRPVSIMFTDYYFYLIAYTEDGEQGHPYYFRVDRIKHITEHRKCFAANEVADFNEGELRKRSLFMWPGPLRTIRFEFSGPSYQAALDKIPTARIIERMGNGKYLIEAETYGDGIKMWLLSQGAWVKVVQPAELVEVLRVEIEKMRDLYKK